MLGGVSNHMLPHLPGVPHLHVNRPLVKSLLTYIDAYQLLNNLTLLNWKHNNVIYYF